MPPRRRNHPPRPRRLRTGALVAGLVTVLTASLTVAPPTSYADRSSAGRAGAVVESRVIGTSVKGRPIRAYRVGDPRADRTVVAMSTMHGDEPATRHILRSIVEGAPVRGIDLWVIPVVNPDGLARGTRKNARGVDLNRNYPYRWADLDGSYESGPRAASEPETRGLIRFFGRVRPDRVVSFHQPLHGVDTSVPAVRPFALRLARGLDLPRKRFVCGGVCHGTFTQWYNHRYRGQAVTVEYGARPSARRMHVVAPRQLLSVLGGRR